MIPPISLVPLQRGSLAAQLGSLGHECVVALLAGRLLLSYPVLPPGCQARRFLCGLYFFRGHWSFPYISMVVGDVAMQL